MEFVLLLVGLVLGALVGWLAASSRRGSTAATTVGPDPQVIAEQHRNELLTARTEAQQELMAARTQAQQELMAARADAQRAVSELALSEGAKRADLEARLADSEATVRGLRSAVETAQKQYRELLDQTRREQAERERASGDESKVLETIAPVAAQIQTMERKIDELEKQRSTQHGELTEQLKHTRQIAHESREAAATLASALRNNQTRGAWGEIHLKTLVESAGLIHHVDFEVQETVRAGESTGRPDMVIKLPGGKAIPVDSKVPYESCIDSHREGISADERSRLLTDHARKVRGHVDALAKRDYPVLLVNDKTSSYAVTPDFTIAYIPNDHILATALDTDPSLMDYAFSRNIVLATPTNLWSVLKTVAHMWRQDDIAASAADINDAAKELYSRLVKMAEYVDKLGSALGNSVKHYNAFVGSLETRVIPQGRKLEKLEPTKRLPEPSIIEDSPRALAAPELTASPASEGTTSAHGTSGKVSGTASEAVSDAASEFTALTDVDRPELDLGLAFGDVVDAEVVSDSGAA